HRRHSQVTLRENPATRAERARPSGPSVTRAAPPGSSSSPLLGVYRIHHRAGHAGFSKGVAALDAHHEPILSRYLHTRRGDRGRHDDQNKIGRASCRERVENSVAAGSAKKKIKSTNAPTRHEHHGAETDDFSTIMST